MKEDEKFVEWDNRFSVGIQLIDNQHEHLIEITNELHDACRLGDDTAKEQFRTTIKEAAAYVNYHFNIEEQIMEKTGYPEFVDHKKIHTEFAQEILKNVALFEEGKKFVPNQFVRFLRDWILSHIAFVDSKMGEFVVEFQKTGDLGKNTMKTIDQNQEKKPVVLAVDDSKVYLTQFKNILSSNFDVHGIISPLAALEMVKNMQVDIILLDLGMEEMNGFDFLENLRKDPNSSKIPVIVVSGYSTEKHISAAKNFGADDFISKPPEPDILKEKIKNLLEKVK